MTHDACPPTSARRSAPISRRPSRASPRAARPIPIRPAATTSRCASSIPTRAIAARPRRSRRARSATSPARRPSSRREFDRRYRLNENPIVAALALDDGTPLPSLEGDPAASHGRPGATRCGDLARLPDPARTSAATASAASTRPPTLPDDCRRRRLRRRGDATLWFDPAARAFVARRESIVVSWFATAGVFATARTGRYEAEAERRHRQRQRLDRAGRRRPTSGCGSCCATPAAASPGRRTGCASSNARDRRARRRSRVIRATWPGSASSG